MYIYIYIVCVYIYIRMYIIVIYIQSYPYITLRQTEVCHLCDGWYSYQKLRNDVGASLE